MKKLLLSLLLLIAISNVYSQDSAKATQVYCEIVGTGNLTGTKVKIEIDFGQAKKYWTSSNDKFMVDETGKEIKFNSMVDAMNYMATFGWHFAQAYVITEMGGMTKQNVYHYILSRNILPGEKINAGIITKKDFKEQSEE